MTIDNTLFTVGCSAVATIIAAYFKRHDSLFVKHADTLRAIEKDVTLNTERIDQLKNTLEKNSKVIDNIGNTLGDINFRIARMEK
jgi:hypothetical protein